MSNFDNLKKELLVGGILVIGETKDFTGNMKKYDFQCKEGHCWSGRLDNVKRGLSRESKGCPECAKNIYNKISQDASEKNLIPGHKIVSYQLKQVKNDGTKERFYKVECPFGHTYEKRTPELGAGCPECSKKTFVGQERTRLIFEGNFGKPFPTVRPNWLLNPETGKCLELDGYCEELKIAFEYQGNQHYSNDTQYGGDFEKQSQRDLLKTKLCEENGVTLVVVEQSRSYVHDKFFAYVMKQIKAAGLTQNVNVEKIDFNSINDSQSLIKKYEEFKSFVDNTSYKLISTQLSTMYDVVDFECSHGHSFSMKCYVFKNIANKVKYREEACPHCYKEKSNHKVREVITLDTCKDLADKLGYEFLSTTYSNVNELLDWKCKHGHNFSKTYRQMIRNQTGKYCPECAKLGLEDSVSVYKDKVSIGKTKVTKSASGEILDFEWLKQFAKEGNLTVLSETYLGVDVKHNFKCCNGHLFTSSISNLKDKKKAGSVFCTQCNGITKVDINYCNNFASENSLECLSTEYKNVNEPMSWKCVKSGHLFEKTFRQMQRNRTGNYCPDCK